MNTISRFSTGVLFFLALVFTVCIDVASGDNSVPSFTEQFSFIEINGGDDEVEFSPDGRFVGITDYRGEGGSKTVSYIRSTATGKKIFELPSGDPKFSPDGRFIVTFFQSWDSSTRKYRKRDQRWRVQNRVPRDVVQESFGWIKVFDVKTGRELYEIENEECSLTFTSDGNMMVDGFLWRVSNGQRLRKLSAAEKEKNQPQWQQNSGDDQERGRYVSPNGKMACIEMSEEKRLLLQDVKTEDILYEQKNAIKPSWSPDGRFLLHHIPAKENSSDGMIRIYDLNRPKR